MPLSPRANSKQTSMPCCDLDVDGVETETAMFTALFDPTEWPPLLNLMDNTTNTATITTELSDKSIKIEHRRKRPTDPETHEINQKRSRFSNIHCTSSEDEVQSSDDEEEDLQQEQQRTLEEKRNVLRISVYKMRIIEDPEIFLRRSVLIHNTIRRLQIDMDQEHLIESTHNFIAGEIEVETENTTVRNNTCLVGFMEYQDQSSENLNEDHPKDMADYTDDDSDDEEDDEEEELCNTKSYQEDRLHSKEQSESLQEQNTLSGCLCYQDSWCRQDCNRGCTGARRESNQCATEYRTSRNSNQGESVFDSVVYQSLLVSLES